MQKIILLLLITTIFSCKPQYKDIHVDYHEDYYPLEVGMTKIYEVDTIKYSPVYEDGKKSFRTELMETITGTFTDAGGREAFRIERFTREGPTKPWSPINFHYAVKDKSHVELVENNLRFIKMSFPLRLGATWNGNAYIAADNDTFAFYQDWEYEVTTIHGPANVKGIDYDSTVTVLEVDDENLLERRYSVAQFAKNTGLIFREQYNLRIVDSQLPGTSIPWEEKANRGFIVRKKLTQVK